MDLGASDDFSPFPSRDFALLFFVLHSPRPMVCNNAQVSPSNLQIRETTLKFARFCLIQCGIDVPSISTIKKFKLPNWIAPFKVRLTLWCMLS